MKKFYLSVHKASSLILIILIGVFALFYAIYDIGLMSMGGFTNVLISLFGLTIILSLSAVGILALVLKKDKAIKFIALAFIAYYVTSISLELATGRLNGLSATGDPLLITYAIFGMLSSVILFAVAVLYILGLFIDPLEKIKMFLPFPILGFIFFQIIYYILGQVVNSQYGAWNDYFHDIAVILVLPLILLFAYIVLVGENLVLLEQFEKRPQENKIETKNEEALKIESDPENSQPSEENHLDKQDEINEEASLQE
jgi:hypothetical protein